MARSKFHKVREIVIDNKPPPDRPYTRYVWRDRKDPRDRDVQISELYEVTHGDHHGFPSKTTSWTGLWIKIDARPLRNFRKTDYKRPFWIRYRRDENAKKWLAALARDLTVLDAKRKVAALYADAYFPTKEDAA